jgi:hypothetical protein
MPDFIEPNRKVASPPSGGLATTNHPRPEEFKGEMNS